MAIKVTENVPFTDVVVVVIVFCVPKSMERVEIAAKPVPWTVMTVPGVPEAGLTKVIEAPVMQKVVVARSLNGPEAVIVFMPEDWVFTMKVALNVPLNET